MLIVVLGVLLAGYIQPAITSANPSGETGSQAMSKDVELSPALKTAEKASRPTQRELNLDVKPIVEMPSRAKLKGQDKGYPMKVIATAYTPKCGNGDGLTATGTKARPGVIAVDPTIIPYGTQVYIDGYGYFSAEDTGGLIKGNRIDIYMESVKAAKQFGKQELTIWVCGKEK